MLNYFINLFSVIFWILFVSLAIVYFLAVYNGVKNYKEPVQKEPTEFVECVKYSPMSNGELTYWKTKCVD